VGNNNLPLIVPVSTPSYMCHRWNMMKIILWIFLWFWKISVSNVLLPTTTLE